MALSDPNALSSLVARALTGAYLVTMMLSMGLELGAAPKEQGAAKRSQRRLLLRGLAINLVLLPLVALVVVRALHTRGDVALALLVLAATPGGRLAPQLTRIARGELGLSVEITLFLGKLTAFTAPLTVEWMLGARSIKVHELTLVAQLAVLQILPYLAGKMIRRRRPSFAARLLHVARFSALACVVAIVAFLVVHREIRSVLLIGGNGWAALLCVAAISLLLGWLLGGPSVRTRRAVALSVNARDLALALVIASLAYPGGGLQSLLFAEWLVFIAFSLAFAAVSRRHGVLVGRPPMVGLGLEG
ncbi:MAG: Bile acid:sodium symporter [Myxococcales bacterium]|nr:Bile acid:sodium symporter [Myxococcales bacterium]